MDDVLYLFPQNHMLPNLKLTPEDEVHGGDNDIPLG
jgi:hypothetical protein